MLLLFELKKKKKKGQMMLEPKPWILPKPIRMMILNYMDEECEVDMDSILMYASDRGTLEKSMELDDFLLYVMGSDTFAFKKYDPVHFVKRKAK